MRAKLRGIEEGYSLNPGNYTIEQVAQKARKLLYEEHYKSLGEDDDAGAAMGFLVAGYSSNGGLAEEWLVEIENGECPDPIRLRELPDCGPLWFGQPEAIQRLIFGYGTELASVLAKVGVEESDLPQVMSVIGDELYAPLAIPPMPIQDAIDFSEFLVHLTIMYSRFSPGAPVVGGPIEIAAITKHEGFKWVRRKHYFHSEFNVK